MKTAAIYLRTSTKKQDPENQLDDCRAFAQRRGYQVPEDLIIKEHASAFKERIKRPGYEKIKELAHLRKIQAVIVFSVSRWIRDRDQLIDDVNFLQRNHVKLHAVKDPYIDAANIEGPMGRTISDLLVGLAGSLAEQASLDRGEAVSAAMYEDDEGVTRYKKTNGKVGRKKDPVNPDEVRKIYEETKSLRKTGDRIGISRTTVSKILSRNGSIS